MFQSKIYLLICLFFFCFCKSSFAIVYDGRLLLNQPTSERLCALTFDDGPSPNTVHILDVLQAHDIKATFFVLGKNALYFPEIIKRTLAEGHEIGNHSFSHPNLRHLSSKQKYKEIDSTLSILRKLGAKPKYMRPPYGAYDKEVIKINDQKGLSTLLWSIDSMDWKRRPSDYSLISRISGNLAEDMSGIVLFHDTLRTTSMDIEKILFDLKKAGCQKFVTVSEYIENMRPLPLLAQKENAKKVKLASKNGEALMAKESYKVETYPAWPAGSTPIYMARCSRPWSMTILDPIALPEQFAASRDVRLPNP